MLFDISVKKVKKNSLFKENKMRLIVKSVMLVLGLSGAAKADVLLGSDIRIGEWQQSHQGIAMGEDEAQHFVSVTLEHMLPMVPNVKLAYVEIGAEHLSFNKTQYTAYYEILDNTLASVDVGIGVSKYTDGDYFAQSFSDSVPHVYASTEIGLPYTGLSLYSEAYYVGFSGNHTSDVSLALRYSVDFTAVDIGIELGYRHIRLDVEDIGGFNFDHKTDGLFLAVNIDL
jgi:outer membrane protein